MDFFFSASVVYLMVSLFALCMTHIEQRRKGIKRLDKVVLGYIACVLWPLTFAIVASQLALKLRPLKV